MPVAKANGIDIYYEVLPRTNPQPAQDPTPLLLIMGLALNGMSWRRLLPYLTTERTVIIFDNRGTGRSSKPDEPYTIQMMADDTAALMDAIGVPRAHILGYSMGSLVAQEFALNYPEKTKGLILGASTAGAFHHILPPPYVYYIMLSRMWVKTSTAYEMIIPILYSEKFRTEHPEIVREDTSTRLVYPTPPYVYRRQLGAIGLHNTYDRLNQLQMPTLLVTGDEDLMVAPQNSQILAKRIPRSELVIFPGGGHNLISEQPAKLGQTVSDFLDKHFAIADLRKAS